MEALKPLEFDQIDPELSSLLLPTFERLGYFGEFFGYSAHCPAALKGFLQISGALRGTLPDDLNEVLALAICHHMGLAYERIQHERLAEKMGFDRAWIAELTGRGGSGQLSALHNTVRDAGIALARNDADAARQAIAQIAASEGEPLAIAVLFQATRYIQVCLIGKTLELQLPVASIFD